MKMCRGIHMRVPLPDVAVLIDPKAILLNPVERLDRLIRCTLPVRDIRSESVGKLDAMVRLQDGQRVAE